ncbi:MAG TPA: hypothetical protein VJA16_01415 [Thermoanaerobaculia bacterium]
MKIAAPALTLALGLLMAVPCLRAQEADAGAVPPWSAESPGAAGAPVAVGLDVVSGREDSLSISSQASVVTLRDLATGRTETTAIPGDPSLLNRKFSIRVRSTGEGAQVPVALPPIPLPGLRIFPTLILQAASTDLSLDFADKPEPADSTSLEGRTPLYGLGMGFTASPCGSCPWFVTAGYRYSTLPGMNAVRSPSFAAPDFEVLQDRTRLSLRRDEGLVRIGRRLPGGRAAAYLGLLYSREQLTDDDTVQLSSRRVAEQMLLSSRIRLASTATAGLTGVEAHVVGPLLLRLEAVFGGGRSGVALKLAYLRLPAPPPPQQVPRRSPDRSQEEVARQILPRLQQIREDLARAPGPPSHPGPPNLPSLPPGSAAPAWVSAAAVAQWLDRLEQELLDALAGQELVALRDSVRDLFRRAREDLGVTSEAAGIDPTRSSLALASFRPADQAALGAAPGAGDGRVDARKLGFWQCSFRSFLDTIERWSRNHQLQIDLTIESLPDQAAFSMAPDSYRHDPTHYAHCVTKAPLPGIWRGLYWYTVDLGKGYKPIAKNDEYLDLTLSSLPVVRCTLAKTSDEHHTSCYLVDVQPDKDCQP